MKFVLLSLLSLMLNANSFGAAEKKPTTEVLFINGNIYPNVYIPPKTPRPQAMAVRDGRISAIGSNEEVLKLKHGDTQVIDLGAQ